MSIDVLKSEDGFNVVILANGFISQKLIKELVQRGLNCWTQAPAELKEFGDMLIEGKVLQDYKAQEHSKPRSE